jgi:tetratricopeptide (TPR) repeat protein
MSQHRPRERIQLLNAAFALDRAGREAEAIPLYQRAIRLGIKGASLRDALICLGSSFRAVGKIRQAVRCLQLARKRFRDDIVVELVLALALHDAGRNAEALRLIGGRLLANGKAGGYRTILLRKYRSLKNARRG